MKKLLILAGVELHTKVVLTAKGMGLYTIVTDNLVNSPAKKIADESWDLDIYDIDGIVERCQNDKIDGVINFSVDPAQRPYQKICEKLNLPCYCTKEQIATMTDKNKFKKFCKDHKVDVIHEYTENEIELGCVEYPVLIKPAQSRGSRGQTICSSKKQVNKAILTAKSESRDGKAIIEKYMVGSQDFTVSYLVVNRVVYKTKIGDRYLGRKIDSLDKQCIATISPSRFTDMYIDKVELKVKEMISALDIKFGPVFLQGFVDGETVRFYDPGLRFPGGDFDLILRDTTGLDTIKTLIHFAITGDSNLCFGNPEVAFRLDNNIGIQLTLSARPGTIRTYEGIEDIKKLPNVISVSKRRDVGEVIPLSGDVRQRVVEISLLAPDIASAKKTITDIYSKIVILDRDGTSMLVSLFDIDLLDSY